jgi:hypothetical protein
LGFEQGCHTRLPHTPTTHVCASKLERLRPPGHISADRFNDKPRIFFVLRAREQTRATQNLDAECLP